MYHTVKHGGLGEEGERLHLHTSDNAMGSKILPVRFVGEDQVRYDSACTLCWRTVRTALIGPVPTFVEHHVRNLLPRIL